jgi:hypothetical protein
MEVDKNHKKKMFFFLLKIKDFIQNTKARNLQYGIVIGNTNFVALFKFFKTYFL